jgi:acetyl esterase
VAALGLAALGVVGLAGVVLGRRRASRVDPQMQRVLEARTALGAAPLHTLSPAQARGAPTARDALRRALKDGGKPLVPERVARVEERTLALDGRALPVRVYTPDGAAAPFPVLLYLHGGGFVVGSLDAYDASARALANQARAVVVSLHYRLAPEHPLPAALDDAHEAFRHLLAHARDFGGDPSRVAVAGEGAGATLALGVALRQRARLGTLPLFQLLVTPFVSTDLATPSHLRHGEGEGVLLPNADLAWFWGHALGEGWQGRADPEVLPLHATEAQLSGLPPTLVLTAALDPLRDEGEALAGHLREAGVRVEHKEYAGVTHEFFGLSALVVQARQAQTDAGRALREAFRAGAPPPAIAVRR